MHYNSCGILIRKVSLTSSTYSSQYSLKVRKKCNITVKKFQKKLKFRHFSISSIFIRKSLPFHECSIWKLSFKITGWKLHIYLILNFESLCVLTASKREWWCDLMVLFVFDQNCWMKSNNWRRRKRKIGNSKTDHLKLSLLTCNNFYYFVPRHCFPRFF